METISLIAPLAAIPAPEHGPSTSETAGINPQSTDFEDLVAQLTGVSNKAAQNSGDKPTIQLEPTASAPKPPGKRIATAASDAEHTSETPLGVIAAVLTDLAVNKKEMPLQAHLGAAIEILNSAQVSPPNQQSARLETTVIPEAAEPAEPEVPDPAKLARVNLETLSVPASPERPIQTRSESAKPGEPQFSPPAALIIPAAVTENNRQSPLTFFTPPLPEAPPHVHVTDSRTIASVVAGSPNASSGKIDPGLPYPDHAIVILSTKQSKDGSLELRLDPPELGSVRISLSPDDNGAIRALVTADRAETLDLVRRHIDVFRTEAGNHGLNNLDFRFESGSQSKNSPDPERKRPFARLTDSFAAGFDGDTIYSAPLSGGGMDVLA